MSYHQVRECRDDHRGRDEIRHQQEHIAVPGACRFLSSAGFGHIGPLGHADARDVALLCSTGTGRGRSPLHPPQKKQELQHRTIISKYHRFFRT